MGNIRCDSELFHDGIVDCHSTAANNPLDRKPTRKESTHKLAQTRPHGCRSQTDNSTYMAQAPLCLVNAVGQRLALGYLDSVCGRGWRALHRVSGMRSAVAGACQAAVPSCG